MSVTRETAHARWHSRTGFIATTLFLLTAIGAPFMVTRGLLEHGALFLPVLLVLLLVLGGPLTRLALATGRLDQRFPGREAIHSVQLLVRLTIAFVLLVIGQRAAAWIVAEVRGEVPDGALEFRERELTGAATAWHTAATPSFWIGAVIVALLVIVFWGFARRRRLAGLSWIGSWLLPVVGGLLALGMLAGYSLSGAGALAALAAPLTWSALVDFSMWGDAVAIALIGAGAQAGIVSSAGRGLPTRARVGRESRIVVAGVSIMLVLGGLVGLLLLCALCARQGIVPTTEHAAPGVLVLELVPALGQTLFPGWPPEYTPTQRQITLGWSFLVLVCCALGATGMMASRRWLPRRPGSASALFGYAAAVAALAGIAAAYVLGVSDPWLPVLTVLPALLALMHVTLARRAGAGMRVVSAAVEGESPRYERFLLVLTFQGVRPILLFAVLAVAVSNPDHGVVLGAFAVAFALMWVGSLRDGLRSRETGMLRAVAAGLVLLATCLPALAESEAMAAFRGLSGVENVQTRQKLVKQFEAEVMRADDWTEVADLAEITEWTRKLLEVAADTERPEHDRARALAEARAAIACRMLLVPGDNDAAQFERAVLLLDGLAPFSRLDEAISAHAGGNPQPLLNLLTDVQARIGGERLKDALESDSELPELLVALLIDMRTAYGAGGPSARELRRYLLQRATQGRTLLKPDIRPGLAYLISVLLAGALLATALLFGAAPPEPAENGRAV